MTDTHQFFGMLKKLKLSRHQAVRMIGNDYAWQLADESLAALFNHAASGGLPIMCFVGNRGCIQIHSGPVTNIKTMGPWINVLDETFHLHLRDGPRSRTVGRAQADQGRSRHLDRGL